LRGSSNYEHKHRISKEVVDPWGASGRKPTKVVDLTQEDVTTLTLKMKGEEAGRNQRS
jgi:hypothetical protein